MRGTHSVQSLPIHEATNTYKPCLQRHPYHLCGKYHPCVDGCSFSLLQTREMWLHSVPLFLLSFLRLVHEEKELVHSVLVCFTEKEMVL